MYYLREHMINFLTKTLGNPNRLLKAVLEDASNNLYMAGCKALGLIDKFIGVTSSVQIASFLTGVSGNGIYLLYAYFSLYRQSFTSFSSLRLAELCLRFVYIHVNAKFLAYL